jgi:ferredoxin
LKVKVDKNRCTGVGNCVAFAPTVFELDREKKAVVLDPSSVDYETLRTAAESCPEQAITIEDDNGRELYP